MSEETEEPGRVEKEVKRIGKVVDDVKGKLDSYEEITESEEEKKRREEEAARVEIEEELSEEESDEETPPYEEPPIPPKEKGGGFSLRFWKEKQP